MKSISLPAVFALSVAASLSSQSASAQICQPACPAGATCMSDGTCAEAVPVAGMPAVDAQVSVEVQADVDVNGAAVVPPAPVQQPVQAQPAQQPQYAPVPVHDARGEYAPQQNPQGYAAPGPSLAHAGRLRLKLGFLLGFGGRQSYTSDVTGVEAEFTEGLTPSYGVELDIQRNFGPVFYSSGTLRYTSLDLGGGVDRFGVFGFDLGIGVHYAFDVGSIAIDPFLSGHVGIAFGSNGEYGAFGLAVAVKAGATLWFHRMIGAYVAAGYRGSAFLSGARAGATGSNLRQGTMDAGVTFRFGE